MPWFSETSDHISAERLESLMRQTVAEAKRRICARPKRVLLLPPDITRMHSGAGRLTEVLFHVLADEAEVHVIPTLGQHRPHGNEENRRMFGSIPANRIHIHDWKAGCVHVGDVPAEVVRAEFDRSHRVGAAAVTCDAPTPNWPIPIDLNRMLIEEPWNLVINIGHVVPHEVLGFANHNKNYFIGLGSKDTICAAHMAAACWGIENNLGRIVTPLRACFNWAEDKFLGRLPDVYVQLVMKSAERAKREEHFFTRSTFDCGSLKHTGLYVGDDVETYLAAARQSQNENVIVFDEPLKRIVCVMQADEFRSTWVANKAIYRTRMALADGGELIVIAPGLGRFGENPEVDEVIRTYGYSGTSAIMQHYQQREGELPPAPAAAADSQSAVPSPVASLRNLAHAAAHLIHGSTEGRFRVTYAPGHLTRKEIERVGYNYLDLAAAIARYRPATCQPGWNTTADGEPFYFIPTPSIGLWATSGRLPLSLTQ
jgi:nickel-dependent lactate racemase